MICTIKKIKQFIAAIILIFLCHVKYLKHKCIKIIVLTKLYYYYINVTLNSHLCRSFDQHY